MLEYEFTLVLDGPHEPSPELEDALFEAGCDDALLGFRDNTPFLDFTRQADSLEDALVSAVLQVRAVSPAVDVIRVEPDELVTASDMAARTGRTRQSVRLLIAGQRGPGGFPAPVRGIHSRARLWRWAEVVHWLEQYTPDNLPFEAAADARLIAAINATLHLQRNAPQAPDHLLQRLTG